MGSHIHPMLYFWSMELWIILMKIGFIVFGIWANDLFRNFNDILIYNRISLLVAIIHCPNFCTQKEVKNQSTNGKLVWGGICSR